MKKRFALAVIVTAATTLRGKMGTVPKLRS